MEKGAWEADLQPWRLEGAGTSTRGEELLLSLFQKLGRSENPTIGNLAVGPSAAHGDVYIQEEWQLGFVDASGLLEGSRGSSSGLC